MNPAKIEVRFADCDLMGHVNNAVYLSYFEQARMHCFQYILDEQWDWKENGIILVKNEVSYLKPVFLHDKPSIFVYLDEIGTKSFTLSYVMKVKDDVVAEGKSKLVCFDFTKNQSVEVYPTMKKALEQLPKLTKQ